MSRLAILAFAGGLPLALRAARRDAHVVAFAGADPSLDPRHRIERLDPVFDELRGANVTEVVLAGSIPRIAPDPALLDRTGQVLAQALDPASGGDTTASAAVVRMLESRGFILRGPHDIAPDLTAAAGRIAGPAADSETLGDAAIGRRLLSALSPFDIGQAVVVAQGRVLGVEGIDGTDALLRMVAALDPALRPRGGVLVKRPKRGQDLRIDMPTIGPRTLALAETARLTGIAIAAGKVLILDRAACATFADRAHIALWADAETAG